MHALTTLASSLLAMGAMALIARRVEAAPRATQPTGYHRIATYPIGGEGSWDYLIVGPGHRVFISRGTHVMVMDGRTGKLVGDILDTPGVHGIAFSTRHNRGYTSNGRENTVTEFALDSLKVIKKIPVSGQNPDCIIYDPVADRVITCNGRSGNVSVIDPARGMEVGKVEIGGKLEFAVSDKKGRVFVNDESKSEIAEIDPIGLSVIKSWSIAPGEDPSGLALDPKTNRLFSVTDGKMIVSDAAVGKVVTTVDIGQGPDAAAFDPTLRLAFSSNGESGTLSVVKESSPERFELAETVPTQAGARTMALDPSSHRIYLVTADFEEPTAGQRRKTMKPNSFTVLVYGRS